MDKAKIIDNIDKELQKMGVYIQADHGFLIGVILHAAGYFGIVEAAQFYADKSTYITPPCYVIKGETPEEDNLIGPVAPIKNDKGEKARDALGRAGVGDA